MPALPADLRKILASDAAAKRRWDSLTDVGRRDFVTWIESAKQPETRKRRVDSVPSRLASGKRRPCCFAVVPLQLYRALDGNAKAKAQWRSLTPDEKRDIVGFVEDAETKEEKAKLVARAIAALEKGKKKP